jgi:hypothetical protein
MSDMKMTPDPRAAQREAAEHIHSWHPACVCGATGGFVINQSPMDAGTQMQPALEASRAQHDKSTQETWGHDMDTNDCGYHDSGFRSGWQASEARHSAYREEKDKENLALSDINDKLRHELAWERDVVQKDLEEQVATRTAELDQAREENQRLRALLAGVVAALAPAPTDPRGYDAATQSASAVDYNEPTEE